jgi:alkanesulfonate monooxygenase SsuD/methylene tetrahydromethanopterin reductase-like flavin-dependent oxidoreductase (luciferase family)
MAKIGYFLSCEQLGPKELIDQAKRAEAAGFDGLWISDHFHPWNDEQRQSPFVWSVIGALSEVTSLPVTTAVTCPRPRLPPPCNWAGFSRSAWDDPDAAKFIQRTALRRAL